MRLQSPQIKKQEGSIKVKFYQVAELPIGTSDTELELMAETIARMLDSQFTGAPLTSAGYDLVEETRPGPHDTYIDDWPGGAGTF